MSNSDAERLSKMRHDLANPLAALLAETQLLLMDSEKIPADVVQALREIETLAIRMRTLIRDG